MALRVLGVLLAAVSVSGLAGCVDGVTFSDATERVAGSFKGGLAETHDFEVSEGQSLRVAVELDIQGSVDIVLTAPDGFVAGGIHEDGAVVLREGSWYEARAPQAGTWVVTVEAEGEGEYAIGVYLRS